MVKEHGPRVMLAFTLNCMAFALAMSAVTTSYWCAGTRKVVKPLCTDPKKVKQTYCIHYNSTDVNNTQAVQYIYETGEEKFLMRKFHTGIWFSCEQAVDLVGFSCRNFLEIAPAHERGVLWLCIVGECLYIALLFTGVTLMTVEMCHCCNKLNKLKVNAFAALLTALAGLFGMVAHMMFTTAFQLAIIMGPEDWKPKTWDYSWSYLLAWASFATCMASAVTALNHYTKTMVQFKFQRRNIKNTLDIMDVGLWDRNLHFIINSTNPLCANLDSEGLDSQCEEYC